ncbi:MAG: glucosyltransferase domain-containing protein [Prolixibacteraceae bacterium]|nr:glucosyltransferase domain-containing protein [Prolixibacteraceae bacterium]
MKNQLEKYSNEILDFFKNNKLLILFSLLVAVVSFGYELFNFTFSIDEELDSFTRGVDHTRRILTGRWGAYYFNLLLFPHSVMPFLPVLITLVCLAFAVVFYIGNEKGDLLSKLVFSAILISFPLHAYYLTFNILNFSIGIALVLSAFSFFISAKLVDGDRFKWSLFLLAIPVLIISLGVYQGMMMVYPVLVIGHLLFQLLNKNENLDFRKFIFGIGIYLSVFIVVFIFYQAITAGLKILYFGEVITKGIYIDTFIMWGRLPVKDIIVKVAHSILAYLSGNAFYGSISMKSLIILVPFIIYLIFKKIKETHFRVLALFLFGLLLIFPFGVMVYVGKGLPPRTLLALPFMLAMLWFISFHFLNKWGKRVLLVCAVGFFLINANINTRLFYSTYVAWQADRDMANRIVERIYNLDINQKQKKVPLAFIGQYKHQTNELFYKSDVFGASFFSWGNGRSDRMISLIRYIGEDRFIAAPKNKVKSLKGEFEKMPVWPYKGSVRKINGVVVVKLSDE